MIIPVRNNLCSVKCGTGTQVQIYVTCQKIITLDQKIENVCGDKFSYKEIPCNMDPCQADFGPWSDWTSCTKTCLKSANETSHKSRTRSCLTDDLKLCNKGRLETQTCKEVPLCPFESKYRLNTYILFAKQNTHTNLYNLDSIGYLALVNIVFKNQNRYALAKKSSPRLLP